MTTATLALPTMTADEFLRLYADDSGVELVDGQLRRQTIPGTGAENQAYVEDAFK